MCAPEFSTVLLLARVYLHTHTHIIETAELLYFTTFSLCVFAFYIYICIRRGIYARAERAVDANGVTEAAVCIVQCVRASACTCGCVVGELRGRRRSWDFTAPGRGGGGGGGGRRLRLRTSIICQRPRHGYTPRATRLGRHGNALRRRQ